MKKIPKRYAQFVYIVFMAIFMSCMMSALITWINIGPGAFPMPWLRNWGVAFVIALPTILVLAPICQRLVARITEAE